MLDDLVGENRQPNVPCAISTRMKGPWAQQEKNRPFTTSSPVHSLHISYLFGIGVVLRQHCRSVGVFHYIGREEVVDAGAPWLRSTLQANELGYSHNQIRGHNYAKEHLLRHRKVSLLSPPSVSEGGIPRPCPGEWGEISLAGWTQNSRNRRRI